MLVFELKRMCSIPNAKMRIRIFSDFCTSERASFVYEDCCKTNTLEFYGKTKDVVFTNDDDYTHVIILNKAMPVLNIPKENVIGFAHEPPYFLDVTQEFIEYAQKYIGKYYVGTKDNLPAPFTENNAFINFVRPLDSIPEKTNVMSIMVSQKNNALGHQYRHALVDRILQTDLPIDIWGRGSDMHTKEQPDLRLKGIFDIYEPYSTYRFHIAIENFETNYYFSEKIINPLVLGTTPIYLGCKNIESFFPNQYIQLTGNIDEDMNLLERICMEPDNYQKQIDIDSVDNTVNVIKNVRQLFTDNNP